MHLIQVQNAHKTYHISDVKVHAVRGVSLSIEHGEFVAITGASGSGKSTFMQLVGCLDELSSGSYRLEGQEITGQSRMNLAKIRNERIGFVFQAFNLLPRTSIVDNVAMPLIYQNVRKRERRRRAAAVLERVGLADRLHHAPNQLSGGQQQRVAVARALVTKPPMVLADEPTGNLDSKTSHEIMRLLRELNETNGVCVVVVTHEADVAAYAERQVVFKDGLILSDQRKGRENASEAVEQCPVAATRAEFELAARGGTA